MADYDVAVIGGGINGLTCATYLSKAGLKTVVIEARGECGAHCETTEPGIPGFLHNLHATWMVTPFSPTMADLELEKYGLEYRMTDYAWGKTFADGKNALLSMNFLQTIENWSKHSSHDANILNKAIEFLPEHIMDFTDLMHNWMFTPPSQKIMNDMQLFSDKLFSNLGVDCTGEAFLNMNGFEIMDKMFESDHIKTMAMTLGWIAGFNPLHRTIGSLGSLLMGLLTGPFYPAVIVKGGSHELTHALTKAALSHGATIMPNCPVKKIIVEDDEVKGVVLSENATYPNEIISAKKVVSNVTVVPTFISMVGEEYLSPEMANRIKGFSYDEQNLFTVHYALSGAPQFKSADFDDGIQKCWMGYFGGDTPAELKNFGKNISPAVKKIHDDIICNFFVCSLADPLQAPEGYHTSHIWLDVPPDPLRWKHGSLGGIMDWDKIKEQLADQIDDTYEAHAPGFKDMVLNRIIYSPLDQYRHNPSSIKASWTGGSFIPEQFYDKRPVPGVLKNGASRTFLKNLYLSNSIHVASNSLLASGYLAACEVAEDCGVRGQDWWVGKSCLWYLENMGNIPTNLGIPSKK